MTSSKKLGQGGTLSLFPRQTATLTCNYVGFSGDLTISWYLNSNLKDPGQSSPDYVISEYSEAEDAGAYTCRVTAAGATATPGESAPLTVVTDMRKPRIERAPTKVNTDTLIKMKCATPNPEHKTFHWLKDGEVIPNTNTSSNRYKIKLFTYKPAGVYQCQASDYLDQFPELSDEVTMTAVSRYELCKCRCPPGIENMTMTEAELDQKVAEIVKNLTVDTTQLSSYIYSKKAAQDKRKFVEVAKGITITVFSVVFGSVLLFDGSRLVYNLYTMFMHRG